MYLTKLQVGVFLDSVLPPYLWPPIKETQIHLMKLEYSNIKTRKGTPKGYEGDTFF